MEIERKKNTFLLTVVAHHSRDDKKSSRAVSSSNSLRLFVQYQDRIYTHITDRIDERRRGDKERPDEQVGTREDNASLLCIVVEGSRLYAIVLAADWIFFFFFSLQSF